MLVEKCASWSVMAVALLAGTLPLAAAAAAPAGWQTVASGAGSSVAVDKSRIGRQSNGQTTAWTRLTLDHPVQDFESQIRYTAVEAYNRYDCAGHGFVTLKRVFLRDGAAVKTEKVAAPRRVDALSDSLDARVLDEVCKPRTVGEMQQTAARAAQQAAALQAADTRPRPMRAEMVSNAETVQPHSLKVADSHAAAPAAEKPRFIEMPLIDKSKAEDPYKGANPAPVPVPAPAAAAQPAAKPAYTPPAAAPARPPAAAPAVRVADHGAPQDLSRKARELQLATSGPRKAAAPKKESFDHVHWGYAGLGAPENWAKLSAANASCAVGGRQSPIDIRGGIKVDLEPIRFDYRFMPFSIVDNGHTVQVNLPEGSSIVVMGQTYQLVQFHFHRPSEERVNGKAYDMVIHLVHKDYDSRLAVIAVLLEKGMEHPLIQTLWNNMPLEVGMEVSPPNVAIDLSKLLPARREYYTYMGSLTTPPCTENVMWMVFKQPVQVSPEQIGIFARMYPNNARPVQPTNSRLVKESR